MHTMFALVPHGVHSHLQTYLQTISKATFTRGAVSSFHKSITMTEIQVETIRTHACLKVLSCDPKGDHVTLKRKKAKPT